MFRGIYVIYDKVSQEYSGITLHKTDDAAMRYARNALGESFDVSDYELCKIGEIDMNNPFYINSVEKVQLRVPISEDGRMPLSEV